MSTTGSNLASPKYWGIKGLYHEVYVMFSAGFSQSYGAFVFCFLFFFFGIHRIITRNVVCNLTVSIEPWHCVCCKHRQCYRVLLCVVNGSFSWLFSAVSWVEQFNTFVFDLLVYLTHVFVFSLQGWCKTLGGHLAEVGSMGFNAKITQLINFQKTGIVRYIFLLSIQLQNCFSFTQQRYLRH